MAEPLRLQPDTRESCHAFYRALRQDPALFAEGEAFVPYRYDAAEVDRRFDALQARRDKRSYAILLGERVIGNLCFKHIDTSAGSCELGVCLTDESVKGRGYGTQAERLALRLGFEELGLSQIRAKCLKQNRRSLRALQKAGFHRTAEDADFVWFSVSREEMIGEKKK